MTAGPSPRRLTALTLGLAGALGGCIEDQTPASLIERTRALAAVAEVVGAPDQVYAAAGETAEVRFAVEGYDPAEGLTWAIWACRAAPIRGGVPFCGFVGLDPDPEDPAEPFVPAPIFDAGEDGGDGDDGLDPDAFLLEFRQDERTPDPPVVSFTLADEILPTVDERCPSPDAPDGVGFPVADVLLSGAICGPGAVPVPPPYLAVLEDVLAGRAGPDALVSTDPAFYAARCVDEATGERSERSLIEEESVSFTLPVRLPAPAPSAQGNGRPRFVETPAPGEAAFLLGQGTSCDPGFDHENGPALADQLAAWPATDATRCDDPAFPEAAKLPFEGGDVCLGVRVVEPRDGDEAMELYDPDGDGVCVDPTDPPPPGTRAVSDLPLVWERLSLATYTTAGELERLFSNYEASPSAVEQVPPPDPPEAVITRNPAFVEWSRPGAGAVPAEGLVVEFVFVLRDRRGGMDVARRKLCLLPPA